MSRQPNILLIFTDQQRFDTIHALNNPVIRTPNLDRLVKSGVAFDSAYSPSPVCVPARCSLHYGKYPMNTGCYENCYAMPETGHASFMDTLSQNGYYTHGIGKCHFTPDMFALRGFQSREVQEEIQGPGADDYMKFIQQEGYGSVIEPNGARGEMYYIPQISQLPEKVHPTSWVGQRSCKFIADRKKSTQPWFLFSSFIHPHPPFCPPAPWNKIYRAPLMPLPKVPADSDSLLTHINRFQNRYKYRDQGIDKNLLRCIKANYYASISFVDYQIGLILDELEKSGDINNTLILFSSDHGEHLGDYNCFGKRSMHDSCARIPMLACQPGRFESGQICKQPVSLVDIAPTILNAAGIDCTSQKFDGEDLLQIANGQSQRQCVYSQFDKAEKAIYTAISSRWKYAYSAPDDQEYLFDRVNDPEETRNQQGITFLEDELKNMREDMITFLKKGCESEAIEGNNFKKHPKKSMPQDPDEGLLIQDSPGANIPIPGYTD